MDAESPTVVRELEELLNGLRLKFEQLEQDGEDPYQLFYVYDPEISGRLSVDEFEARKAPVFYTVGQLIIICSLSPLFLLQAAVLKLGFQMTQREIETLSLHFSVAKDKLVAYYAFISSISEPRSKTNRIRDVLRRIRAILERNADFGRGRMARLRAVSGTCLVRLLSRRLKLLKCSSKKFNVFC